jgi:predicted kinase
MSVDRKQVLVLRGIPGSGKSTFAKDLLASRPYGSTIRINNDDLGTMFFGTHSFDNHGAGLHVGDLFHDARIALLKTALDSPGVNLVVVDNTNLSVKTVKSLEKAALSKGAEFIVDDQFLTVPVEVCIARDAVRSVPVTETIIRKMASQAERLTPWVASKPSPVVNATAYNNDISLPSVVLVDIDGTLALMNGRMPYDWNRVGEDLPNIPVVKLVKDLLDAGQRVIVMSGRDGVCAEQTRAWLDEHVATGLPVYLRAANDNRRDDIIKYELFQKHIADKFHVRFVLDDRDQVIHLWRRVLGLPTFQVADGAF